MARRRKQRQLTDEELQLWRAEIGEADPLPPLPESPPPPKAVAPAARRPRAIPLPGAIDPHEMKAIRRGHVRVEARVDLHGMTQANAHVTLVGFLKRSAARGLRCVLVITGKGGRR